MKKMISFSDFFSKNLVKFKNNHYLRHKNLRLYEKVIVNYQRHVPSGNDERTGTGA
jgi:hypothetical protein